MQQSSAPSPIAVPGRPEKKPALVQAEPKRPRGRGLLWLAALAAAGAGLYWLYQRSLSDTSVAARRAALAATRTSTVGGGTVVDTIRLTGTTGPEKFVTILGPQLRGNRSGSGAFQRGGSGGRGGGGGSVSSNGGSNSSGGGSSSSSGSGSSSSGASAMGASISSNSSAMSGGGGSAGGAGGGGSAAAGMSPGGGGSAGGVRSAANALRSATSRVGGSSSRSSMPSSRSSGTASSALGSDGLGSTSGSLYGGGGTGGGGGGGGASSGGDFGTVLQQLVKPGSMVKKGETVAEFDRQFMLQRVDDYKTGVDQQELNLKRQQAEVLISRKSHEQSILSAQGDMVKAKLDLKTIPVRSDIDTERFKLAAEENDARYKQLLREVPFVRAGEEAQIKISEMDLKQSELELRRAEANANRMIIKSPIEGMVVMLQMFRGSEFGQVQQGDMIPTGMPFMQIVDPSSMIVNAFVNQVDTERIRVGAKARVRFDAFPDLELPGHVFSVAAMPKSSYSSRANYLKEIPVRIKLDKMDPRVIPDLSVSVDVIVEEQQAAAVVSLASVFQDAPNGPRYVFVRTGEGWERRPVELGLTNAVAAVVKSGLKPGEVVAEERPPQPGTDKDAKPPASS